jgi:hypothetical protein
MRVKKWLAGQEHETLATLAAVLFLRDSNGRRARAERWSELHSVQAPFDREDGWLVPGGSEAVWLYEEAERAYVYGLFLATLHCAHAACERVLAACLLDYERQLDKNWRRWGLGSLTTAAFEMGLIDEDLKQGLERVTRNRKVSAHFKPPITRDSVVWRAYTSAPDGLFTEQDLDQVLHDDALAALEVATELLRGDQGFAQLGSRH